MQKKFIGNLWLLLLINLLIKPFWIFGIDRTVQNIVGADEYGFYTAILNFSYLFNILLDAGITNFNSRSISRHPHRLKKYLAGILPVKLLLVLIYFAVSFLFAGILGYDSRHFHLFFLLGINQVLSSGILYLRSNIQGLLWFRTDALLSVLDKLLMILFSGLIIWGNIPGWQISIESFIYAQTAGYLLTALTAFAIVAHKARFTGLTWNYRFFLSIIKQSYPFAILTLLMGFYTRFDFVLLERLLPTGAGTTQAGIYAHGYRILDAANNISYLFAIILLPLFARLIKKRQPVLPLTQLAFSLLFVVSAVLVVTSWFNSGEIMQLLYNDHLTESAVVFNLLIASFIGFSGTYIFGTLLTANGNLKALNFLALASVGINLALNFILIPQIGARGAAITGTVTQLAIALMQIVLSQKLLNLRVSYLYWLKLTGYFLLVLVAGWLLELSGMFWFTTVVLLAAAGVLFAFMLNLIDFRKAREYLTTVRSQEKRP